MSELFNCLHVEFLKTPLHDFKTSQSNATLGYLQKF